MAPLFVCGSSDWIMKWVWTPQSRKVNLILLPYCLYAVAVLGVPCFCVELVVSD